MQMNPGMFTYPMGGERLTSGCDRPRLSGWGLSLAGTPI